MESIDEFYDGVMWEVHRDRLFAYSDADPNAEQSSDEFLDRCMAEVYRPRDYDSDGDDQA